MTLTDVHADPRLLADLLGVPFEAGKVTQSEWYGWGGSGMMDVTAEERAYHAWGRYLNEMHADFSKSAANQFKGQTWPQLIAECCSKGLGIKKGKVAERVAQAIASRPDIYTPAPVPESKISYNPCR